MNFQLTSAFKPSGDQPQAIEKLTKNLKDGVKNQVLLGVTGSGKSVVHDTVVLIQDAEGRIKKQLIGKLINDIFENFPQKILHVNDTDVINTHVLPLRYQFSTFSFDHKSGRTSWKKVTQVTRHLSPKQLYTVTTACGKEVIVTNYHNFFVLRNGHLILSETSKLTKNDYIPLPLQLDEPKKTFEEVYLPNYLNARKLFVNIPTFHQSWPSISSSHKLSQNFMSYGLLYGERVTYAMYQSMLAVVPKIKKDIMIGIRARDYQKAPTLLIDNNLMRLLGYYIAEGHAEVVRDIKNTLETLKLQLTYRQGTYDYYAQNTFWSQLLSAWCGKNSGEKHLPDFWINLSNIQLSNLLRAYFSTDGGIDGNRISCTTLSKTLASDLTLALLRFGIISRTRIRHIRIPNRSYKHKFYQISISGQKFLQIFNSSIGFSLNEKQLKLQSILKKDYNTNVDIIPVNSKDFKSLRLELQLSQQDLARSCDISRTLISLIESGKRNPSRTSFERILACFKVKAGQLKDKNLMEKVTILESLLQLFWSPIKKITVADKEEYVYDFAVQDNETFLANGVFVHNTYTMAQAIANVQKPTLIISHNKTLAGQLYQEFREFFPNNAVSYFVSYYDYYQPEAYIPTTDTYIEKEAEINEEIDKLRLSSTTNLLTRKDVIVVASVSCIYNIGSPVEYGKFVLELKPGMKIQQRDVMVRLADLQYERYEYGFKRGSFRVRGESIDLFPAYSDFGLRIEIENNTLRKLEEFDPTTGETIALQKGTIIYPSKHYMTDPRTYDNVFPQIKQDMERQVEILTEQGKIVEAQRIRQRTTYDLEMIREVGYVNGIENYSRYFDGREPGDPPYTLLDYMKACSDDWLLMVDESHITVPQIRGMYNGDRARKETLIDYGFRLPSALDNRPLKFEEFMRRVKQVTFVSATPDEYEISLAQDAAGKDAIVEQLIRPTGIVDPEVNVKPTKGQIPDLMAEIEKRTKKGQRVLVTTLTKRMSEELTSYLEERGIKVAYLHSDIVTLERQDILDKLRRGDVDVLVGINLLREGLDLPEVALVAILDADKEGFLRSRTSLIQTMGRAARNIDSEVILYADVMTKSMDAAIKEVERRREAQLAYNKKHGITPKQIEKTIRARLIEEDENASDTYVRPLELLEHFEKKEVLLPDERDAVVRKLRKLMQQAAKDLDFERAAEIRDRIKVLQAK